MLRRTCFVLAVCLLVGSARAQQPAADLNANAALKYWQAFASLPKFPDEQQKHLDAASLTTPVDERLKEIVRSSADALREMHHGAKIAQCAWAVSMEDGVGARLNHASGARQLARIAELRIRERFAEGRAKDALDDALATATLGRHVSTDGTIISLLVGYAIEATVTETIAAHLRELDKATLKDLAARWEKLPVGGTLGAAMLTGEEKGGIDWFIRVVNDTKDPAESERFLKAVVGVEMPNRSAGPLVAALAKRRKEGLIKDAEELRPLYREFAAKEKLPPDQYEKQWNERANALMEHNPVAAVFTPGLGKCRWAAARHEARSALWKAALAILVDGPDAAKMHRDPFGDGPFDYTPFEGGFELRSKLRHQDKPVALMVGQRKK
jgi:hypothetical protein